MNIQIERLTKIYNLPLADLLFLAAKTRRKYHKERKLQKCALLSIKTGACSEDCSYCPQSAHYDTDITSEKLMQVDEVIAFAKEKKKEGAVRFCMGAAWRGIKDGQQFDNILEMVKGVKELEMEVCCTLGLVNREQISRLKTAGMDIYNHNIDTGPEFYDKIISTRTFDDRISTLESLAQEGVPACSGGIIGMGESIEDRIEMIFTLASLNPQPESVPINLLIPIKGTPLENCPPVPVLELVRIIALARIAMPHSRVRLSAGRTLLSETEQALCLSAGADSIFIGEKLLTAPNADENSDDLLMRELYGAIAT